MKLSSLSALALACFVLPSASAFAQSTTRISVSSSGEEGDSASIDPVISASGRLIAFASIASNLVVGDSNGTYDVFLHDRLTGATTRVSVDSQGGEGDDLSGSPGISADGRFVCFSSAASNLVAGDTNQTHDIFVHEIATGLTSIVSVDSLGVIGDGPSNHPTLSADGRFVVFDSYSSNLVGLDFNGKRDVFVHDRATGVTSRVSVDSFGVEGDNDSTGASISANGRYVVFSSKSIYLVPGGDTNLASDIFLHDRLTSQTTRVSVDSTGNEGNGGSLGALISPNGRYVSFSSWASNFYPGDSNATGDSFVHDRLQGTTTLVSLNSMGVQGDTTSGTPLISDDGRFVSFSSKSTNFVSGDTNNLNDVFFRDLLTGVTTLISSNSVGDIGDSFSFGGAASSASADFEFIVFGSFASNLIPADANGWFDAFVHNRLGPSLEKQGLCPGNLTLTVLGGTVGQNVAFVFGTSGYFLKPNAPCRGIELGISNPVLGAVAQTNSDGAAAFSFLAPAGACGLTVQGVDLTNCAVTNVMVL